MCVFPLHLNHGSGLKLIISLFLRYQFSMWSHDVIATSILLAGDLKLGQYCNAPPFPSFISKKRKLSWFHPPLFRIVKIPPRVMVLTQIWGTILGCFVNYAVMAPIVTNQREVLLSPVGTNVWSKCLFSTHYGAIVERVASFRRPICTIAKHGGDHLVPGWSTV